MQLAARLAATLLAITSITPAQAATALPEFTLIDGIRRAPVLGSPLLVASGRTTSVGSATQLQIQAGASAMVDQAHEHQRRALAHIRYSSATKRSGRQGT